MSRPINQQLSWADAVAVTPNDGADLPGGVCGGLLVTAAGTGTLSFITAGGATVSLTGVTLWTVIPIAVTRVRSTGTNATVLALY
jgi:hypothetical protein